MLIPNLKFVGVYGSIGNFSTPTWKFGIATVAFSGTWAGSYASSISSSPVANIIVMPGFYARPSADPSKNGSGVVIFTANNISTDTAYFTAILFNY